MTKPTLYHYPHCPFCVRVRLALGFLGRPWDSVTLPYDDEETPVRLAGRKMLPIMDFGGGDRVNESLDILRRLDGGDRLRLGRLDEEGTAFTGLLDEIGAVVSPLCMPVWAESAEFDAGGSRAYFRGKKEARHGPFADLAAKRGELSDALRKILEEEVGPRLKPFYGGAEPSVLDLLLAAHLQGPRLVPGFAFPDAVGGWLAEVERRCAFDPS